MIKNFLSNFTFTLYERLLLFVIILDLILQWDNSFDTQEKITISHTILIPYQIRYFKNILIIIICFLSNLEICMEYNKIRRIIICISYALSVLSNRHDCYQHHYLLIYILFCLIYFNKDDKESFVIGSILLKITMASVYFWSCITKLEFGYMSGTLMSRMLIGTPLNTLLIQILRDLSMEEHYIMICKFISVWGLHSELILLLFWIISCLSNFESTHKWKILSLIINIPYFGIMFHCITNLVVPNIRFFSWYMVIIYCIIKCEDLNRYK